MDQNQRQRQLQAKLVDILGSKNVYYNPPSKLLYPCILYSFNDIDTKKANNKIYSDTRSYTVTLVSQSIQPVDSEGKDLVNKILYAFDMCSFDRPYASEGLWHFVFKIYF